MDEKTRIEKDIVMFEENLQQLNDKTSKLHNNKIVELATQYYEDSKYYLEKKDYFTAFGCIKGTHLHPSTVRETLSKMHEQKLIYRKKIKNDNIGKNPYIYYAISPVILLKRYSSEMEDRLNKLANLTFSKEEMKDYRPVRIKIVDGVDDA